MIRTLLVMALAVSVTACEAKWGGWEVSSLETPEYLRVVRARAPDDVLAGGNSGVYLLRDEQWTRLTTESVTDFWAVGDNELWVSEKGLVRLDRAGLTTIDVPLPPRHWVKQVWGLRSDDLWVQRHGFAEGSLPSITALRWNGQSWRTLDDPRIPTWGIAPDDAWSVSNGTLSHWDGRSWTTHLTSGVRAVWGLSSDAVWAVGERETLWSWNGSVWTLLATDANSCTDYHQCATFNAVWATGPNDVWVVGESGPGWGGSAYAAIHHWDGEALTTNLTYARSPRQWNEGNTVGPLRFITGFSDGTMLATDGKTVLRRP